MLGWVHGGHTRAPRAARRGHELRVLCRPHRAAAERPRRGPRHRQLRHGACHGRLRPRPCRTAPDPAHHRGDRLPGAAARRGHGARATRDRPAHPRSAGRVGVAVAAGAAAGDGAVAAVRRLAVDLVRAHQRGRVLGRRRVPPRGSQRPAPRRRHDGHADLDRHPGRMGVVGSRDPVPGRGRAALPHVDRLVAADRRLARRGPVPGGGGGGHDPGAGRPFLRGPGKAPGRGCAARAAGAGRTGGNAAGGRSRTARTHGTTGRWRYLRGAAR